jgi:nitric oxide dioxygenase|tara:strand:+ start:4976 stop:5668 length:693 start_codon:yes stop_codon:yes gene_type:complete
MVKAMIREITQETPDVKRFILELDKNMPFKAGQFVMLKIDPERFDKIIPTRAYSIANAPNNKFEIHILAKIIPNSKFSKYLGQLEVMEEIEVQGPYGRFTLSEKDNSKHITLVGAGTGIAPLVGIMDYALQKNLDTHVIYCDRGEEHLINIKQFDELTKQNKISSSILTTRDKDSERIQTHVTQEFLEQDLPTKDTLFFVCGPLEFVNNVVDHLTQLGVGDERIKTERYG